MYTRALLARVTFLMAELLLDPDIRLWVIVPIVIISLLVGVTRHYVIVLLQREKKITMVQVKDR